MWNNILDKNMFINSLYEKIPELKAVRISEIKIQVAADKVTIILDLPRYADRPPAKWKQLKYNTTVVELDLFEIKKINIKSIDRDLKCDIEMSLNENGMIAVKMNGSINGEITAVVGLIQSVRGYYNKL
jgi:hypothetical protein